MILQGFTSNSKSLVKNRVLTDSESAGNLALQPKSFKRFDRKLRMKTKEGLIFKKLKKKALKNESDFRFPYMSARSKKMGCLRGPCTWIGCSKK